MSKRSYYEKYIPLLEVEKMLPDLSFKKVGIACVRVLATDECKNVDKITIKGKNWGTTHLGNLFSEEDIDFLKKSNEDFKKGTPASLGHLLGATPLKKREKEAK